MKKKIILIITATLVLSMAGCSKGNNDSKDSSVVVDNTGVPTDQDTIKDNAERVVVTVNGQEVTFDELRIYLQSQRDEIEAMYGDEIWSMEIDKEGTTYEEMFKKSVFDQIVNIKLVCSQAETL